MGIAERRVQEHISDAGAADVQRLGGHIREDDAAGVDAAGGRLGPYTGLAVRREAQQPQHGVGHAPQDVAPGREGLRIVLVELVGARVDDPVLWKAHLRARRQVRLVQDILHENSGQMSTFLALLSLTRKATNLHKTTMALRLYFRNQVT